MRTVQYLASLLAIVLFGLVLAVSGQLFFYEFLPWLNIIVLLELLRQDRIKGMLTSAGLKTVNRQPEVEVPFEKIKKLTGFFTIGNPLQKEAFPVKLAIFTAGDSGKDMSLTKTDFVKLASTGLNQWVVGYESFEITPGAPGVSPSVIYSGFGKYSAVASLRLMFYTWLPVYTVLVWAFPTGAIAINVVTVMLIFLMLALRSYKKVTVSLSADSVSVETETGEYHSLAFDDIDRIEKGFFQAKVIAKHGQALPVPAACRLLPELIEELAGLN